MNAMRLTEADIARFQQDFANLENALNAAIVGQNVVVEEVMLAVFAGGHVLLEGLPGLGKTNLIKALANAIGVTLGRVQCTPDLMPSDITGSEVLVDEGGAAAHRVEFRPGPVFASMVLVDEINRATPKTQAALLEAMQEGRVTYGGTGHALPQPFWVFATQNPIELEGTYPLPEAQLDRFLFKVRIAFPPEETLLTLVDSALDGEPADEVGLVLGAERVAEMMAQARETAIAEPVKRAAIDLVLATHAERPTAHALARAHFRCGASPRALQALLRVARVRALAAGRGHVSVDDIAASVLPALRHRILLTIESELDGTDTDAVLEGIVAEWRRTS